MAFTPETPFDVVSLGLSINEYNKNPTFLNGLGVAIDGLGALTPFIPAGIGIIRQCDNIIDATKLPKLDSTGKLHGDLPHIKDLKKLDKETLRDLRDDLTSSLKRRKQVTKDLGPDPGHGRRESAEESLRKSLNKHLGD